MQNRFRYWQLVRLTSSGRCQTQTLSPVQDWMNQTFADLWADPAATEGDLQTQLVDLWRSGTTGAELAQLSLRCYITHQIRYVCLHLDKLFGETYGFTATELFPLVLDDDGQPSPRHQPFTLEVLASYQPQKSRLGTWASQLTKTHPDLNRALLEKGLYRASDWAILNDTTPAQVERILRQYHLGSEYEVAQAVDLIGRYHQVYSRDRLQQRRTGQRGHCLPPTPEQLQQMDAAVASKQLLHQLKTLASQLRQYRIHVRGGKPQIYGSDLDWEQVPAPQDAATDGLDDQQAFLATYREVVVAGLDRAIAEVIRAQLPLLAQRQPPRDGAYVQGLHLFHCQGVAMGQMVSRLGLNSPAQVTRLLQLKRLRAEVRHHLIRQLQASVRQQARQYISAEQLQRIDQTLDELLTQEVDQLIQAAAAEAQSPHRQEAKSLFADQLCKTIHQFLTEAE